MKNNKDQIKDEAREKLANRKTIEEIRAEKRLAQESLEGKEVAIDPKESWITRPFANPKKDWLSKGILLFGLYVLYQIAAIIGSLFELYRAGGLSNFDFASAGQEEIMEMLAGASYSLFFIFPLIFTIVFVFAGERMGFNFLARDQAKEFTPRSFLKVLLLWFGVTMSTELVGQILIKTGLAPDQASSLNQTFIDASARQINPLMFSLGVGVFIPIIEEYTFRGSLIQGIFKNRPWLGGIISVFIFTLLHGPANIFQAIPYSFMAIAMTYLFMKTRDIKYPIAYHMINNIAALILMYAVT